MLTEQAFFYVTRRHTNRYTTKAPSFPGKEIADLLGVRTRCESLGSSASSLFPLRRVRERNREYESSFIPEY